MPRKRAQKPYYNKDCSVNQEKKKEIGRGSEERDRLKEKEGESAEPQRWNQMSLLPQVTKTNLYKPRGKIDLADGPA